MTFSKTLLPNIGGSFENHQNILVFPLKFEFHLSQFVYFHFEWLFTKVSQSLDITVDRGNIAKFFMELGFCGGERRLKGQNKAI